LKRGCQLLCDLDRGEEALQAATVFTVSHPASEEGWTTRGHVEMRLARHDAAEASLAKALEIRPASPQALRNLALLRLTRGNHESALPILEKARAANPADFDMRAAWLATKRHLCDWNGL